MNETMKAYLAGVLDADGYFTIKRSTYSMRVRGDSSNPVFSERVGMKQVVPIAVDLLHEHFGGYRRIEKSSAKNGKPLHAWSVTDKKACHLVRTILPYMRIKRKQAELLLELRKSKEVKRVQDGTFEMTNRWGAVIIMPRRVVDPKEINKREQLHSQIKGLNDTRPFQPRLVGKG
jgi:hypothetical protein